jgi:hypothetical protein
VQKSTTYGSLHLGLNNVFRDANIPSKYDNERNSALSKFYQTVSVVAVVSVSAYDFRRNVAQTLQQQGLNKEKVSAAISHKSTSTKQFDNYGDSLETFDLVRVMTGNSTNNNYVLAISPFINNLRTNVSPTEYRLTKEERNSALSEVKSLHQTEKKSLYNRLNQVYGANWEVPDLNAEDSNALANLHRRKQNHTNRVMRAASKKKKKDLVLQGNRSLQIDLEGNVITEECE